MLRRPILLNRPLKSKKATAYRPGAAHPAIEDSDISPTQGYRVQGLRAHGFKTLGTKRTARLADKREECATDRRART